MDSILGVVFLLSGYTNGAELTMGVGFTQNEIVFQNPVGIVRVETEVFAGEDWNLKMRASHLSSIPDPTDNFNGSDINMASIEFSVDIGNGK
jgi:hypothetical protein